MKRDISITASSVQWHLLSGTLGGICLWPLNILLHIGTTLEMHRLMMIFNSVVMTMVKPHTCMTYKTRKTFNKFFVETKIKCWFQIGWPKVNFELKSGMRQDIMPLGYFNLQYTPPAQTHRPG